MQVILRNARLSFPDLFQRGRPPKDKPNDPGRYAGHFIIEPTGENMTAVRAAVEAEALKTFGPGWAEIVAEISKDKKCLRNGNSNRDDKGQPREGYAGMWFVKASNNSQPEVVGRQKSVIFTGPRKNTDPVGHPHVPYSGCYVNAVIDIYASKKHGDAINASLMAVQYLGAGTAFGGGQVTGTANLFDDQPDDPAEAGADPFGEAQTPPPAADPWA